MKKLFIFVFLFSISILSHACEEFNESGKCVVSDISEYHMDFLKEVLVWVPEQLDGVCSIKDAEILKIINRTDGISYALEFENNFIEITDQAKIKVIESIIKKYEIPEKFTGDGRENHQSFEIQSIECRFDPLEYFIIY